MMTNETPGTDHVISGPMRGLEKKLHPMDQTDRHPDGFGDSMTESAQWGRFSENLILESKLWVRRYDYEQWGVSWRLNLSKQSS